MYKQQKETMDRSKAIIIDLFKEFDNKKIKLMTNGNSNINIRDENCTTVSWLAISNNYGFEHKVEECWGNLLN